MPYAPGVWPRPPAIVTSILSADLTSDGQHRYLPCALRLRRWCSSCRVLPLLKLHSSEVEADVKRGPTRAFWAASIVRTLSAHGQWIHARSVELGLLRTERAHLMNSIVLLPVMVLLIVADLIVAAIALFNNNYILAKDLTILLNFL